MAGATDAPFRQLCRELGADLAVTEMVKAAGLSSLATPCQQRLRKEPHDGFRIIQIVGNQPFQMAKAAQLCVDEGADIIDINMGCPAKKYGKKPAGSALLADLIQVEKILSAVIRSVSVPVTVKIRTGIDETSINALQVGKLAQESGIQALTVHGRTRAQKFNGRADHSHTAQLAAALDIPVIANGDIDSPEAAKQVMQQTGAHGLMMGRGARNNPFIFRQVRGFLDHDAPAALPTVEELTDVSVRHLSRVHTHYSSRAGEKAAKQIGWILSGREGVSRLRQHLAGIESESQQRDLLMRFLENSQHSPSTYPA